MDRMTVWTSITTIKMCNIQKCSNSLLLRIKRTIIDSNNCYSSFAFTVRRTDILIMNVSRIKPNFLTIAETASRTGWVRMDSIIFDKQEQ